MRRSAQGPHLTRRSRFSPRHPLPAPSAWPRSPRSPRGQTDGSPRKDGARHAWNHGSLRGAAGYACGGLTMSNAPSIDNDLKPEEARPTDEEASWFERLLQTFGLGEEPDLRELIEDALARSKSDTLSSQERSMLRRILRLGTLTIEDVMVPRADIIAVDDTISVADLMGVFRQAEHSRVPVYHETLDDPRGMVHIRDLMSWITSEAEACKEGSLNLGKVDLGRNIASINILREILYVPGSMSVLDLLLKMQTTRLHLALVVDEYGGTDGLVSIEDLVEEVVGDIADEHDVEDEPLIKSDPRLGLVADARTPISDLEKHLGLELASEEQEEEVDTLGGLVFAIAGRIPARGELVQHPSGIEFEVLDADPRRIKKLRIHLPPAAETGQAESAGVRSTGVCRSKTCRMQIMSVDYALRPWSRACKASAAPFLRRSSAQSRCSTSPRVMLC